jgi:hypothetical protein
MYRHALMSALCRHGYTAILEWLPSIGITLPDTTFLPDSDTPPPPSGSLEMLSAAAHSGRPDTWRLLARRWNIVRMPPRRWARMVNSCLSSDQDTTQILDELGLQHPLMTPETAIVANCGLVSNLVHLLKGSLFSRHHYVDRRWSSSPESHFEDVKRWVEQCVTSTLDVEVFDLYCQFAGDHLKRGLFLQSILVLCIRKDALPLAERVLQTIVNASAHREDGRDGGTRPPALDRKAIAGQDPAALYIASPSMLLLLSRYGIDHRQDFEPVTCGTLRDIMQSGRLLAITKAAERLHPDNLDSQRIPSAESGSIRYDVIASTNGAADAHRFLEAVQWLHFNACCPHHRISSQVQAHNLMHAIGATGRIDLIERALLFLESITHLSLSRSVLLSSGLFVHLVVQGHLGPVRWMLAQNGDALIRPAFVSHLLTLLLHASERHVVSPSVRWVLDEYLPLLVKAGYVLVRSPSVAVPAGRDDDNGDNGRSVSGRREKEEKGEAGEDGRPPIELWSILADCHRIAYLTNNISVCIFLCKHQEGFADYVRKWDRAHHCHNW